MCFDTAITVLFCWCFPLTAPEDARYRKFSWKIAVQIIILQSPHNNTLRVLLLSIHYEEYIYHSKDGKNWDCPLMGEIMGVFFSVKKKHIMTTIFTFDLLTLINFLASIMVD